MRIALGSAGGGLPRAAQGDRGDLARRRDADEGAGHRRGREALRSGARRLGDRAGAPRPHPGADRADEGRRQADLQLDTGGRCSSRSSPTRPETDAAGRAGDPAIAVMQPDLALARQAYLTASRTGPPAGPRSSGGSGWAATSTPPGGIGRARPRSPSRRRSSPRARPRTSPRPPARRDLGDGATPVQPGAFAGVDASGRTLDGLLYGAVTTRRPSIGRGPGLQSALTGRGRSTCRRWSAPRPSTPAAPRTSPR
jgi:hypothetical protein